MANEIKQIRAKLIEKINTSISEVGNKPAIAKELNMSLTNLYKHLDVNGKYVDNIDKLGEIGEVVARRLEIKRNKAHETLNKITEKING